MHMHIHALGHSRAEEMPMNDAGASVDAVHLLMIPSGVLEVA